MGSIVVDSDTSFSIHSAFLLKVSIIDVDAVGCDDRWVLILILIELAFWLQKQMVRKKVTECGKCHTRKTEKVMIVPGDFPPAIPSRNCAEALSK